MLQVCQHLLVLIAEFQKLKPQASRVLQKHNFNLCDSCSALTSADCKADVNIQNIGGPVWNTYNSWYELRLSDFSHYHWVVDVYLLFRLQLLYSIISTDKQSTSGATIPVKHILSDNDFRFALLKFWTVCNHHNTVINFAECIIIKYKRY